MPMRPPVHRPLGSVQAARMSKRARDLNRKPSHERGYDWRWRKATARSIDGNNNPSGFLARNPLCVECLKRGETKLAEVVDHKIPHKGDMDLFWDESNWQSLCKADHDAKTARQDGGFGRRVGGGAQ